MRTFNHRSLIRNIMGSSESESDGEEAQYSRNRSNTNTTSRRGFARNALKKLSCVSTFVETELEGSIYCAICLENYLPVS